MAGKIKNPKKNCKTRFPIMLVHGAAFRDDSKLYNYWGRIPKLLRNAGADIYYSGQDAWGSIESNAEIIKKNVMEVLSKTGVEKINLIAHSKGGLEARYLISELNMGSHIASLTTISTPHHGSKIVDIVYGLPKFLYRFISALVNLFFRISGDKNPDFYNASRQLSSIYCREFNDKYPPKQNILYQSYATRMKNPFSDILFLLPYTVVKIAEGDNDGLVTVTSARYGKFKGVFEGDRRRGVSHADAVDLRRKDNRSFNIIEFYINIADELRRNGY
jgi:triacylglycerol lipase